MQKEGLIGYQIKKQRRVIMVGFKESLPEKEK
jgi:hypothetical protein